MDQPVHHIELHLRLDVYSAVVSLVDVVRFATGSDLRASGISWQATPAAQNLRPKRQHLIACVHCFDTDTTTPTAIMSLISGEKSSFQFILRLLNTNVRPTNHLPDMAQLGGGERRAAMAADGGC